MKSYGITLPAPVSDLQNKAIRTSRPELYANGSAPSLDVAAGILHEIYTDCASTAPDQILDSGPATVAPIQARFEAALLLCPTSPRAAVWQKNLSQGKSDAVAEANGTKVFAGTHKVPSEMGFGTWEAEDVKECYWETRDDAGSIIENDFVVAAPKVRVNIGSGVTVFTADCGPWRKQG